MASQKQLRRHEKAEARANTTPRDKYDEKADHTLTDSLLDEIDDLLEDDAQAFVSQYIQKGGQ